MSNFGLSPLFTVSLSKIQLDIYVIWKCVSACIWNEYEEYRHHTDTLQFSDTY